MVSCIKLTDNQTNGKYDKWMNSSLAFSTRCQSESIDSVGFTSVELGSDGERIKKFLITLVLMK